MRNGFESYIETALWTYEEFDGMSLGDIHPETRNRLRSDFKRFVDKYEALVTPNDLNTSLGHFAHNMWLTQNGHGAGFWDGDYKNGDALTTACENELGHVDLYVGDDSLIYGMWSK